MKNVIYAEMDSMDTALHFSTEEFFTRCVKSNVPVLMLWQTEKTVMLGNNQVVEAEIDIDFATKQKIRIIRRSSGGGAIYTDIGTVLYTVIQPLIGDSKIHMEEVAANIIDALHKLEVPAAREGRNDILIEGKKISGIAQYISGNHICTHGSLLYDTDLEALTKVLIPNENKLHPKGITSIRSRVTNIKPYIKNGYTVNDFKNHIKSELLKNKQFIEYEFSNDEYKKIKQIYNEKYNNPKWNLEKVEYCEKETRMAACSLL
jgi:lipoate-protein ligase A